jgi:hypothetical protein
VLAVASAVQYPANVKTFTNKNPELFEKGFSWKPTSPDLVFTVVFCGGYLKDRVLQKSPHTIPEMRMIIQSEIEEVISLTPCVGIQIHIPPQDTKFLRLTS